MKNRTVTRLSEKDEKKVLKQQKHKEQQYKARKRKAEKHKAQEYKVREYKNQEYKAQEHKEPERKEGERFQISEALNRERAVIQRTISQAGKKIKKSRRQKRHPKLQSWLELPEL